MFKHIIHRVRQKSPEVKRRITLTISLVLTFAFAVVAVFVVIWDLEKKAKEISTNGSVSIQRKSAIAEIRQAIDQFKQKNIGDGN
jgi:predicted PurR-regulated permease PerM